MARVSVSDEDRAGKGHGSSCPSDRCSASLTVRPEGDRGQAPPCTASSAGSPPALGFGGASPRTSCVTPTRSNWPARGWPLNIIPRQLGHANLGTTSIYLQGIDPEEIIATVHMRRVPMMSASAGLRL